MTAKKHQRTPQGNRVNGHHNIITITTRGRSKREGKRKREREREREREKERERERERYVPYLVLIEQHPVIMSSHCYYKHKYSLLYH